MAKKKTVSDLSKSGQVNSFTGGINTDLHPMLQPNDTLTDCLNGTLITYNGNENMLQNDMGNYELKHAQLPEGYIPMGMREHQGVLYIASWNPFTKKAQIGSYPSPKTSYGDETSNTYTISPIQFSKFEIGEGIEYYRKDGDIYVPIDIAEVIFRLAEKLEVYNSKHEQISGNYLLSEQDFSQSEVIFTSNFDENTTLNIGDRYLLSSDLQEDTNIPPFQSFKYFIIDKNKNKFDVTEDVVCNPENEKFQPVTFTHNGWLGAKYEVNDIEIPEVDVTITENTWRSENIVVGKDSSKDISEIDSWITVNESKLYNPGVNPDNLNTYLDKYPFTTAVFPDRRDITPSSGVEDLYIKNDDIDGRKYVDQNDVKIYIDDSKTQVIDVKYNRTDTKAPISIPEGITTIISTAFNNIGRSISKNIKLELPTTLRVLESPTTHITFMKISVKGNVRLPWALRNISTSLVVVPARNIDYYKHHRIFWSWSIEGNGTSYEIYELQRTLSKHQDLIKIYNPKQEYKLLSEIKTDIEDLFVLTPHNASLLEQNAVIEYEDGNNNVIISFIHTPVTFPDKYLINGASVNSVTCGFNCSISSEIASKSNTWVLSSKSSIDLSGAASSMNIYLFDLDKDSVSNFIQNLNVPENIEINLHIQKDLNIVPSVSGVNVQSEEIDIPEPNSIVISLQDAIKLPNCKLSLSSSDYINTYKLQFNNIENKGDINTALDLLDSSILDVLKRSVLLVPDGNIYDYSEYFGRIVSSEESESKNVLKYEMADEIFSNLVYAINSNTTNIVQGGLSIETSSTKECGESFIIKAVYKKYGSSPEFDYGIKFKTTLFYLKDGDLSTRMFCGDIPKIESVSKGCSNTTPIENSLSIKTTKTNSHIAAKITYKSKNGYLNKYVNIENGLRSIFTTIDKSAEYSIDFLPYLQGDDKLLIYDVDKFSKNINLLKTSSELSGYKYGYNEEKSILFVQLQWLDIINLSSSDWVLTNLSGEVLYSGVVPETEGWSDEILLEIPVLPSFTGVGIFQFIAGGRVYKKPILLNTKIRYNNGDFDNSDFADYSSAYYNELVDVSQNSLENIVETTDLDFFGTTQIGLIKPDNENFTFDSRYIKESPNAFWWNMFPDMYTNNPNLYLGTRKYQKVTIDLQKLGFVKDQTSFSISLHNDEYDKDYIVRPDGKYTGNDNSKLSVTVPTCETKTKIVLDAEKIIKPFTKKYLIQDTYQTISDIDLFEKEANDTTKGENLSILSKMCGWDNAKMLAVDKASGEDNNCTISLLDPNDYDSDSDIYKNGKICSGEGDVKNILENVSSFFVPIIARVKTNDNGFVFPVPKNSTWKDDYKEQWIEARTKKNSDNKRSLWKDGIAAVVHTKNNMAAALANLFLGLGEFIALIGMWVGIAAALVGTYMSGVGFAAGLIVGTLSISAPALLATSLSLFTAGCAQFTAGLAELLKKEKTFQLLSIRGKNRLLLPLFGQQSDTQKFPGQARYETECKEGENNFYNIEKLMYYIGSRIYSEISHNEQQCPKFDEKDTLTSKFSLVIKYSDADIKAGNFSISSLNKMFNESFGIFTNNFKTNTVISQESTIDFTDCVDNDWTVDEYNPQNLQYQIDKFSRPGETVVDSNQCYSNIESEEELLNNIAENIYFDVESNRFIYSETDPEEEAESLWSITDSKFAFGPNRGGCAMRLKRKFIKKNGDKSKTDHDAISIGEFPVFNTYGAVPIAYPIIPVDLRSGDASKNKNYFNSYNIDVKSEENCSYVKDFEVPENEKLIADDCINYLKFVYYAGISSTNETNK